MTVSIQQIAIRRLRPAVWLRCEGGQTSEVELAAGIPITRLPEARQQILDGTFLVFDCAGCGRATAVTAPTVYTDFERHQYVVVETPQRRPWSSLREIHTRVFEDSFTLGPPIATEMASRFSKRGVYGFPALREKLLIWDAHLDDLVVEVVKAEITACLELRPDEVSFRLRAVLPGGHLLFSLHEPVPAAPDRAPEARPVLSRPVEFETVPADAYHACRDQRHGLVDRYPWLADDWIVDFHDGYVDALVATP